MQSTLDLSKINYPSDLLTIKAVRSIGSDIFATDSPLEIERNFGLSDLASLLHWERALATLSYNSQQSITPTNEHGHSLSELRSMLAEQYAVHGICSGQNHANELVKSIESQARSQASNHAI